LHPTELEEIIYAWGHENILATHPTTLEFTKDSDLSKKGNCIIAVLADKAIDDLDAKFKKHMRKDNVRIAVSIEASKISDDLTAFGCSKLVLNHPTDAVIRKSSYICDRTLAIKADKAACDLSRRLVKELKNPRQQVKITLKINV
jgi:hypothetical protein